MWNCCKDKFKIQESGDSFQMWQGLRGPYFTPQVSSDGTLSWVNNGGLPNPASVNIKGPQGEHGDALTITGVAETVEGLPADPERGDLWLVGTEAPLTGYVWLGQWVNIGQFAIGPKGDPGDDGRTPTISATATTGAAGSSASVTRTGTDLRPVFNFRIPRGDTGAQGRQGIPGNPGSKVETVEGSGSATGIGTSGANITVQFSNIPSGGTLICESVVSITAGTPKDITAFYKKSQNTSASTYFVASSTSQNVGIRAVRVYVIDSTDTVVSGVKGEAESTYRTGDVNITPANIGLGNVNNTSDANKPISTATQEALDAKADAEDVTALEENVDELSRQLSDLGNVTAFKAAILQLAQKVAYIDEHGQDYYDDLYDAFYPPVPLASISAVFTQGQAVVYDTDSLDVLKPMLVVTAVYSDGTSGTVSTSDYTLSGTLSAGTSTITVSYGGKTDTFSVSVTHRAGTYSVTNNLTNCTNSNGASTVIEGENYSGTISSNSGYTMTGATVRITMGGTDITSTAYNNGAISIASVTGNVVITASAVQITGNLIATLALGTHEVYPTDNIQSLKKYLTVELHNGGTTTPVSEYTLSGSIDSVGTHVITISYNNYTTTVNVPVVANTTGILYEWDFTDSLTDLRQNQTATLHTGEAWEIPGKSEGTTVPTRGSTGVILDNAQQLIRLIGNDVETSQLLLNKTIQVDFAEFDAQGSPDSMRVIMVAWDKTLDGTLTHELGLHWAKPSSTRGWCFYSGGISTETGSRSGIREELAPGVQNDISGKTVSLYYDSTGHASLYFNTTLKGTSNNTIINDVCTNVYGLQIGSGGRTQYGGTLYSGRVTGARIYSGNAMQQ